MVSSNDESPRTAGYAQPAEWAQHQACYTAWPAHDYAWESHLGAAQREFIGFARAFVEPPEQEPLHVLVDEAHRDEAAAALAGLGGRLVLRTLPYGDVWLRDTAPIFLRGPAGADIGSVRFRFNGWGGKYTYPHDCELAERIAALHPGRAFAYDYVLEGGAIEVDGEGTCLTTRSCLLNPNRGAPEDIRLVEQRLRDSLGVNQVIWLDQGLANDHTDGHIDNIVRFVAPGVLVCMEAHDRDDPNRDTLDAIADTLEHAKDASGRPLEVVRIPSPGRVLGADGRVAPASHMNFYIGNARVLLPVYGTDWDEPARAALQVLFSQREVVACSARAILEGGGTFHCMTQQVPTP